MLFSELARYFQKLENTTSRNTMTEILADLFSQASNSEIGPLCYLLQGRVAPLYEATEFGVADKLMIRAIGKAYNSTDEDVLRAFKRYGDLGITAEAIAQTHTGKKTKSTINDVFTLLKSIAQSSGDGSQETKIRLLSELFAASDALSVRYIARIPLDKLRLGFSDMTILDGLSWMLTKTKKHRDTLEAAYDVRPDLGYIATQIKEHGIHGVSHVHAVVGAPILAALCQRLPNADEMIKKMGEVDVEPKYDGVRTQIHFIRSATAAGPQVSSFSRNLENTTSMYPELALLSDQIDADEVILDSEAVGYDQQHDRLIPFQETMSRKRKHDIADVSRSIPLRFFVFDILYKNGKDLMGTPLSERRKILEHTIKKGSVLFVSPHIVTDKTAVLRTYHDEQIKKGLEGVVIKKWESVYEPGRRGYTWVKFKEEGKVGKLADTIDGVIMGFYRGEGKRSGFGIGAFLVGIRRGETIVSVTKIGTGVSDALWKELLENLQKQKTPEKPKQYNDVEKTLLPDVWVEPTVIVEIGADDITKSPIHGAQFALRFPRLVRIRTDKSIGQITSVTELETMYRNQETIKR